MIKALGVRIWSESTVSEVGDGAVTVATSSGTTAQIACGTLIEALDELPTPFEGEVSAQVIAVGDANAPYNISEAIAAGNQAARTI